MVAIVFWLLVRVGTVLFWVHILLHRKPPVKPFRRFFRSYLICGSAQYDAHDTALRFNSQH